MNDGPTSPEPTSPPEDPLAGPNDPQRPEPNQAEQSLEERLQGFENRLKLLTGVVSIVALAAPIASAVAAVGSLLTARDSLNIAQTVQRTSGANISVDQTIHFAGSCQSQAQPLMVRVQFHNAGHLASRVTRVDIAIKAVDTKGTWGGYDPGLLPVAMDEDVGVIGGDDGWAMRTAPLGVVSGAVVGSVTGSSAW